jgi:lysophospholipase L1-like esterase
MANPNFFLTRSEDAILAFELTPGFEGERDENRLRINRFGLREDSDDRFEGRRKIAILGDSVTMSVGHTQEKTIDSLVEGLLHADGGDAVVLNFGVGGYGTRELAEFLKRKNEIYDVDHVVYLMNPNDFARRDSVYEGADNGLYRMFVRPLWHTRWFLRKGVYRLMKGGAPVSVRWYRWLFAGNEAHGQTDIRDMAAYCASEGAEFSVVLLPSGVAYTSQGYELADIYARLKEFLAAERIPALVPIEEFRTEPGRYFDETDHFVAAGNERIAELIARFVVTDAELAAPITSLRTGRDTSATTSLPAEFR